MGIELLIDDVLAYIFTLIQPPTVWSKLKLTQVSRRWRDVALANPVLWSTFRNLINGKRLSLILKRAGNLSPIKANLVFFSCYTDGLADTLTLLVPHVTRIVKLDLWLRVSVHVGPLLSSGIEFPFLLDLNIRGSSQQGFTKNIEPATNVLRNTVNLKAPRLRSLALTSIRLGSFLEDLPINLETVSLVQCRDASEEEVLAALLAKCKRLRSIKIHKDYSKEYVWGDDWAGVHFDAANGQPVGPALQDLDVRIRGGAVMAIIYRGFPNTPLQSISVTFNDGLGLKYAIDSLLLGCGTVASIRHTRYGTDCDYSYTLVDSAGRVRKFDVIDEDAGGYYTPWDVSGLWPYLVEYYRVNESIRLLEIPLGSVDDWSKAFSDDDLGARGIVSLTLNITSDDEKALKLWNDSMSADAISNLHILATPDEPEDSQSRDQAIESEKKQGTFTFVKPIIGLKVPGLRKLSLAHTSDSKVFLTMGDCINCFKYVEPSPGSDVEVCVSGISLPGAEPAWEKRAAFGKLLAGMNSDWKLIKVANAVAHSTFHNTDKIVACSSSFVTPQNQPATKATISTDAAISADVGLKYLSTDSNDLVLTHVIETTVDGNGHLVKAFVDASTGEHVGLVDYTTQLTLVVSRCSSQEPVAPEEGMESVVDPEDKTASPSGWTTFKGTNNNATSGNNIIAYKGSLSNTTASSKFSTVQWTASSDPKTAALVDQDNGSNGSKGGGRCSDLCLGRLGQRKRRHDHPCMAAPVHRRAGVQTVHVDIITARDRLDPGDKTATTARTSRTVTGEPTAPTTTPDEPVTTCDDTTTDEPAPTETTDPTNPQDPTDPQDPETSEDPTNPEDLQDPSECTEWWCFKQ
ncbi:hypothetical protein BKA62DRAFT_786869 [Auriculariales sp. MPI-PUGE-AT-0066]|nr:hypothetical protein BKA62DRAFT_786869 [Auriculariales sp. MPI-PUGE-AT-0066]